MTFVGSSRRGMFINVKKAMSGPPRNASSCIDVMGFLLIVTDVRE